MMFNAPITISADHAWNLILLLYRCSLDSVAQKQAFETATFATAIDLLATNIESGDLEFELDADDVETMNYAFNNVPAEIREQIEAAMPRLN